jgi:hypothetical protein
MPAAGTVLQISRVLGHAWQSQPYEQYNQCFSHFIGFSFRFIVPPDFLTAIPVNQLQRSFLLQTSYLQNYAINCQAGPNTEEINARAV